MQKIAFEASYDDDNYDSQQEGEEDERLEAQEKIMQRLGLKGFVNFVGAFGNKPGIAVHPDGKTAIDPAEQVALDKFLTSTAPLRTTGQPGYQGGQGVTGAPPAAPAKPPVRMPVPAAPAKPPAPMPVMPAPVKPPAPMPVMPAPVKPPVRMPAKPAPVKPPAPMPAKPAPAPVKPVATKPKGIPSGSGGGDLDDY